MDPAAAKRIILLGDGRWGAAALGHLSRSHELPLLIGRRRPTDASFREAARALGREVLLAEDINGQAWIDRLREARPDLLLSVSYDQVFRSRLLEAVRAPIFNLHAGDPSRYRGRAVLCWQLLEGRREVLLCVIRTIREIDRGPVLAHRRLTLDRDGDYASALAAVCKAVPGLLDEALTRLDSRETGASRGIGQSDVTDPLPYPAVYPRRGSGDEWIDWEASSTTVLRKIRALAAPNPLAATTYRGRLVRIGAAEDCPDFPPAEGLPGCIIGRDADRGLLVKTGDRALWIDRLCDGEGRVLACARFSVSRRFGFEKHAELHRLRSRMEELDRNLDARVSRLEALLTAKGAPCEFTP